MKLLLAALSVALLVAAPASAQTAAPKAASKCALSQVGEFKVAFERLRPLAEVRVNGQVLRALIDTGAATTTLTLSGARTLGLRLQNLDNIMVSGAGGNTAAYRGNLADFEIAGAHLKNFGVIVAGERLDAPLVIGRDFLGRADLEVDFRAGVVRLLEPKGCSGEQMPYWAAKGYSEAPLTRTGPLAPFVVEVRLNGTPVRAMIDTGAQISVAVPAAASRAGVKLQRIEEKATGLGPRRLDQSVAQLESFALGDEKIGRTRLRVADLFRGVGYAGTGTRIASAYGDLPEMLLGADFLRAHRMLISPSHRAVYFTYEGGPIFDTSRASADATAANPPTAASASAEGRR